MKLPNRFWVSKMLRAGFQLKFPDEDYGHFAEVEIGPFRLVIACKIPIHHRGLFGKIDLINTRAFYFSFFTLWVFKFWSIK